jgi:hypothetical protein
MAGRSVVEKTMMDGDLNKLVNQMIGLEDPDPAIIVPRYRRIYSLALEIISLLEKLLSSPLGKTFGPFYPASFGTIVTFIEASKQALVPLTLQENDKTFSGAELHAINSDPSKLRDLLAQVDESHKIAGLGEKFNNLKSCSIVQNIIFLTRNIKTAVMLEKERRKTPHHDLEVKTSLGDGFIINSDGDTLELFPFSNLNFKSMMNSDRMTPELRQYTLYWLHLVYVKCLTIADDITSPPIDIEKFSNLMVENIAQLDAQIPRCREAFAMIKNSVGMMKDNFKGYYKDFLSTGTPSIIVEHFLVDVAQGTKSNPKASFQFRQIWKFYSTRMQAQNIKDPRVKKMLSMLSSNLDVLEDKPKKDAGKKGELVAKDSVKDNIHGDDDFFGEDDGEKPGAKKEPTPQLEGEEIVAPGKREKSAGKPVAQKKSSPVPTAAESPSALKPVLKKKSAAKKR